MADYYSRNIFCIPHHTSVSAVDSSYVEADGEQHDLTSCPDIQLLFDVAEKLLRNIEMVDKAVEERKKLLEQLREVKKQCDKLSQNAETGNDLLKDENVQKSLTTDLQ